jgi:peptidoglycan/LPS O-acetylase OafA/YrhL
MPRKLRITLCVAIGLVIAVLVVIISPLEMVIVSTLMKRGIELPLPLAPFYVFFTMLFACGMLIVYWTQKTLKQRALRRYLFLAGASALGILFFQVAVHPFTEFGMVMAILVCPAALIVGAVLALRYKANLKATE